MKLLLNFIFHLENVYLKLIYVRTCLISKCLFIKRKLIKYEVVQITSFIQKVSIFQLFFVYFVCTYIILNEFLALIHFHSTIYS